MTAVVLVVATVAASAIVVAPRSVEKNECWLAICCRYKHHHHHLSGISHRNNHYWPMSLRPTQVTRPWCPWIWQQVHHLMWAKVETILCRITFVDLVHQCHHHRSHNSHHHIGCNSRCCHRRRYHRFRRQHRRRRHHHHRHPMGIANIIPGTLVGLLAFVT